MLNSDDQECLLLIDIPHARAGLKQWMLYLSLLKLTWMETKRTAGVKGEGLVHMDFKLGAHP